MSERLADDSSDVACEILEAANRRALAPTCWRCGLPLKDAVEEWLGMCASCEHTREPAQIDVDEIVEAAG